MRVCLLVSLTVAAGWSSHALAADTVTVSLVKAGSADTSVTVASGGSFSVDISVQVPGVSVTGIQLQLEASVANVLDLTSGTYNAASWDDNTMALTIETMALDTIGTGWIGSAPKGGSTQNTTTVLATVELAVDASATDGTYTLNAINILAFDSSFAGFDGVAGPGFSVVVSSGGSPPGGGGTTPPDDGGTTPPDDGGTTPPDDGGTTPPDDGDGTTQPGDDGETPPDEGGTTSVVTRCGAGLVETLGISLTCLLPFSGRLSRRQSRPT